LNIPIFSTPPTHPRPLPMGTCYTTLVGLLEARICSLLMERITIKMKDGDKVDAMVTVAKKRICTAQDWNRTCLSDPSSPKPCAPTWPPERVERYISMSKLDFPLKTPRKVSRLALVPPMLNQSRVISFPRHLYGSMSRRKVSDIRLRSV
jgi:hypothetical protein